MSEVYPDSTSPMRLSELVCARFCHDLAGPLGSLAGMVELARDDVGASAEALSVMEDATAEMGQRLRLLRAAWTGDGGAMDVSELRVLAQGLPNARRLRLDLDAMTPTVMATGIARTILNLLLLASESLPAGGRIELSGDPGTQMMLRIEGQRAAWPAGLGLLFSDDSAAWAALDGPRTLAGPLAALTARSLGIGLSMLIGIGQDGPSPLLLSVAP